MFEAILEFLVAFFEAIAFGAPARPIRWIGLMIIKIYKRNPMPIKELEKDFEFSPTPYLIGLLVLFIVGFFIVRYSNFFLLSIFTLLVLIE